MGKTNNAYKKDEATELLRKDLPGLPLRKDHSSFDQYCRGGSHIRRVGRIEGSRKKVVI